MYVLQLGVFKNYANALEKKESVKGSMIYQNKELYYVLAGLSKEETGLYKIEKYLQTDNISYYKKQMPISLKAMDKVGRARIAPTAIAINIVKIFFFIFASFKE